MSIIGSAAYFKISTCGRYGRIYTTSEQCSMSLCSKEEAFAVLGVGVEQRLITGEEALAVREQIQRSNLSAETKDVKTLSILSAFLDDSQYTDVDEEDEERPTIH